MSLDDREPQGRAPLGLRTDRTGRLTLWNRRVHTSGALLRKDTKRGVAPVTQRSSEGPGWQCAGGLHRTSSTPHPSSVKVLCPRLLSGDVRTASLSLRLQEARGRGPGVHAVSGSGRKPGSARRSEANFHEDEGAVFRGNVRSSHQCPKGQTGHPPAWFPSERLQPLPDPHGAHPPGSQSAPAPGTRHPALRPSAGPQAACLASVPPSAWTLGVSEAHGTKGDLWMGWGLPRRRGSQISC